MAPWWVILGPYLGIIAGIVYLTAEFFIGSEKRIGLVPILIGLFLITTGTAQLLVRRGILSAEVYAGSIWLFLVLIGVTTIHALQKKSSMEGPV